MIFLTGYRLQISPLVQIFINVSLSKVQRTSITTKFVSYDWKQENGKCRIYLKAYLHYCFD